MYSSKVHGCASIKAGESEAAFNKYSIAASKASNDRRNYFGTFIKWEVFVVQTAI